MRAQVSRWRMYLFTVIQLGAFVFVCVVKSVKVILLLPSATGGRQEGEAGGRW